MDQLPRNSLLFHCERDCSLPQISLHDHLLLCWTRSQVSFSIEIALRAALRRLPSSYQRIVKNYGETSPSCTTNDAKRPALLRTHEACETDISTEARTDLPVSQSKEPMPTSNEGCDNLIWYRTLECGAMSGPRWQKLVDA